MAVTVETMEPIPSVYEPADGTYPPDMDEPEKTPLSKKPRWKKVGTAPKGMTANKKRSQLMARERQGRALELRKAGSTYAGIAKALGFSDHQSARNAVLRAYSDIVVEPAQELRTIQYERLNFLLLTLWPKCQAGDERSIQVALSILSQMDKIMGTEAPQKIEMKADVTHDGSVLIVEGNKDEFIRQMARMAGVEPPKELEEINVESNGSTETNLMPEIVYEDVSEDHEEPGEETPSFMIEAMPVRQSRKPKMLSKQKTK